MSLRDHESYNDDDSSLNSLVAEPALAYSGDAPIEPELGTESYNNYTEPSNTQCSTSKKIPFWRDVWARLRPDYILDHLTYTDFKVVFRSWIQIFVGVILCTLPRTSHWLGNPAYLLQVFGFILISGGKSIQAAFMDNSYAVIGSLIGWLFQVLTSKIADRIRGGITVQQVSAALIQEGACTLENINTCVSTQVYTGRYLETRTTVISIVALIIGVVTIGYLERYSRLLFISGIISLVINICYTVFFPYFEPLIVGLSILKPTGVSCSLGFVCAVLIFPHTTSFQYWNTSLKILKGIKTESTNNLRFFGSMKPSEENFDNYRVFKQKVQALKQSLNASEILLPIIPKEVSYGRLNLDHVDAFRSLFRSMLHIFSGFDALYEFIQERKDWAQNNLSRRMSVVSRDQNSISHGDSKFFTTIHESYKTVGEYEKYKRSKLLKQRILNSGFQNGLTLHELDYITVLIRDKFSTLLEVTDEGLAGLISWLEAANEFRVYSLIPGRWSTHKELQKKRNQELQQIKNKIIGQIEAFQDPNILEDFAKGSSLNEETLLCLINELSLFLHLSINHGRHILRVIDLFLAVDKDFSTPQIVCYLTSKLGKKTTRIEYGFHTFQAHASSPQKKPSVSDTNFLESNIQGRNPDADAPSSVGHIIGIYFIRLYKLLLDPKLWFLIRAGGLVCIAATPYFVRTTAHWYFSQRLVWVVIMTGLSMNQTTGQTAYVFGSKLVYSFLGAIVGMVGWYICRGNYYGYATVCGVIYLYMVFYRHFSSHLSLVPGTLFTVTAVLVLGTSWVDLKYNHTANVGEGFRVAYTRFISVMVGLCIGFLACLVPKPHSSRHDLRMILAKIISETGNIHCYVSRFGMHRLENPEYHALVKNDKIIKAIKDNFARVYKIGSLTVALTHEFAIVGAWPKQKYKKLQETLYDITSLYFLIMSILDQVRDPETWIPIMFRKMGWTDSSLNGDLFAVIHMMGDSMLTKNELPKITESNLSVKHMDILTRRWGLTHNRSNEGMYKIGSVRSLSENSSNRTTPEQRDSGEIAEKGSISKSNTENHEAPERDGEIHRSMMDNLDFHKIFSTDGQLSTNSLVLAHMLYERFDQMMVIIKSLVGEKFDFDQNILEDSGELSTLLSDKEELQ